MKVLVASCGAAVALGFGLFLATYDDGAGKPGGAHAESAQRANAPGQLATAKARSANSQELQRSGLTQSTIERLAARLGVDPATIEPVGSFALQGGGRHELYSARTSNGGTCLVEERPIASTPDGRPMALWGGGCSPGALGPGELKVSVSAAGNVDDAGTSGLSVVGVAGDAVREVRLDLGDGREVAIPMNARHGFQYTLSSSHPGRSPSIRAFDARGVETDSESIG